MALVLGRMRARPLVGHFWSRGGLAGKIKRRLSSQSKEGLIDSGGAGLEIRRSREIKPPGLQVVRVGLFAPRRGLQSDGFRMVPKRRARSVPG